MEQKLKRIIYFIFYQDNAFRLPKDDVTEKRVQEAVKKATTELKSMERTEINLPFIFTDIKGPKHIQISVTYDFIEKFSFKSKEPKPMDLPGKSSKEIFIKEKKEKEEKKTFTEKYPSSYFEKISKEKQVDLKKKKRKKIILFILMLIAVAAWGAFMFWAES